VEEMHSVKPKGKSHLDENKKIDKTYFLQNWTLLCRETDDGCGHGRDLS
jgi:hypothetical protein